MNKEQLKHLIREAARATGQSELYVIGSQAIHAAIPDQTVLPNAVSRSREADMFPVHDDAMGLVAAMLERDLGVASEFDISEGIYVDTVGPETVALPAGWRSRLLRLSAGGDPPAYGLCPEPNDLCVSKLARSEEKDLEFVTDVVRLGLASSALIRDRLRVTDVSAHTRTRVESYLDWLDTQA